MTGRAHAFDAIVLGAGIVGVSTAIHLRKRGLSVALVDRRGPGEETSHGNAGIIEREGVHPYLFPRDLAKLIACAFNLRPEAHYQLASLPSVAPFLWRYFLASGSRSARRTLAANIPLFAQCLTTHGELAADAGAQSLISKGGWLELIRTAKGEAHAREQLAELKPLGIDAGIVEPAELAQLEPHLATTGISSALHFRDPWTVSDPGALTKAYAKLFERIGGVFIEADAMQVRRVADGWKLADGRHSAPNLIVALGPWSKAFLDNLGLYLPMGVKRGYHRHYAPAGNAFLTRPILDAENGYVLAPMARGIRLTTGAEFARLDAPKNPVQIEMTLPLARKIFPLGETVDSEAWMGARPVMPDMLPVIGPVEGLSPGLSGVYLNFGHAHHGLTLGPVTGKLLAQIMTGEEPVCDPSPYSPRRFLA